MTRGDALEYSVRVSDRARKVRLTVSAREGLVVVVPRGALVDAGRLVRSREPWARRALERVAEKRAEYLAGPEAAMPATIDLAFTDGVLPVRYEIREAAKSGTRAVVRDGELVVEGAFDARARIEALRRWLSRCARTELPERASTLARLHGLKPSRVRITTARQQWGSCSAAGTISLNRSLMLLPDHLADAVIAHELAHLRVMNHSAQFWRVAQTLDPAAMRHRAELARAAESLPAWLDV